MGCTFQAPIISIGNAHGHKTPETDGDSPADPFSLTVHQMQTRLSISKGSGAKLLQCSSPPGSAEIIRFAHTVDEQVNLLHHVVNELVAAPQVARGILPADPESTDLQRPADPSRTSCPEAKSVHSRTPSGHQTRILALNRHREGRRRLQGILPQGILPQGDFANVSIGKPDDAGYLITTEKPELILLEATPALVGETGPVERLTRTPAAPDTAAGSKDETGWTARSHWEQPTALPCPSRRPSWSAEA